MTGQTITANGIGGLEALRIFADVLGPASISIDHPRFLSFVPAAPTEAAMLFDLVVGASSIYGGSWLEGGGAVFAENEALRYIADLVGLPRNAAGVFVSGGTAGNLSALIAARFRWRHRADGAYDRTRGLLLTGKGAHSSVASAARAMDADLVLVPADEQGRMWGAALRETYAGSARGRPRAGLRDRHDGGYDQRRCDRRSGRGCRGVQRVRRVDARRRRVRRRRPCRAERARPLPRHRARRQLHRRSAQVVVRAVRLLRARLPRSRPRSGGPHPTRRVPRRVARRKRHGSDEP